MLSLLENHATYQLLCYAAGQQMFCPICKTCLDWSTVVHVGGTGIVCGDCFLSSVNRAASELGDDLLIRVRLQAMDITTARNLDVSGCVVSFGAQVITDPSEV